MTGTLLRLLMLVSISAAGSFLGCQVLRDLSEVQVSLSRKYQTDVRVNLTNADLAIVLPEKAALGLRSEARLQFAREIAAFAYENYRQRAALRSVSVVFESRSQAGPVRIAASSNAYRFETERLRQSSGEGRRGSRNSTPDDPSR